MALVSVDIVGVRNFDHEFTEPGSTLLSRISLTLASEGRELTHLPCLGGGCFLEIISVDGLECGNLLLL